MDTFEKLLVALSSKPIDYILIGGLAVDLCGYSRATMDVDILIDHKKKNIERLLDCLKEFGEGSVQELSVEDFNLEEGCIRIIEDFPLDVFTIVRGKTYDDLLPYKEIFLTEGVVEIPFLNHEGLILLKEGSSRPKDKIDVLELKKVKERGGNE